MLSSDTAWSRGLISDIHKGTPGCNSHIWMYTLLSFFEQKKANHLRLWQSQHSHACKLITYVTIMLLTQIYGMVTFLGNHNQTQVHGQHYPAMLWNTNLRSQQHMTTTGIQVSHYQIPAWWWHLRSWVEFKHTLGNNDQEGKHESCFYSEASLTQLLQFFGMALPSKIRTMAGCEQYPTHPA